MQTQTVEPAGLVSTLEFLPTLDLANITNYIHENASMREMLRFVGDPIVLLLKSCMVPSGETNELATTFSYNSAALYAFRFRLYFEMFN